jgi:asparagine synthase (glutamine-hydrolysing)
VCDFVSDGSFGVFAKLGKMATGESLLIREPYFDREVVDDINRLPQNLKVKGSQWQYICGTAESKFYLRRALAMRVLPRETLLKRKRGFTPPMKVWLHQRLQGVDLDKLLSPQVRRSGYFDLSFVEQVLHEHLSGTRDHTWLLFMLLIFDLWHRLYIESFAIDRPTLRLADYYK